MARRARGGTSGGVAHCKGRRSDSECTGRSMRREVSMKSDL